MRLIVDASTLVAELLRVKGRALIQHPDLDLVVTIEAWSETRHELRRRLAILAARGLLEEPLEAELRHEVATTLETQTTLTPQRIYADRLEQARWRIPRDPSDTPTLALALVLDCGIWTNDHDFFGCGIPVWATETLRRFLAEQEKASI